MTTIEWLAKLIAFDTTSHFSNLSLITELETYLSKQGFELHKTYNHDKTKANLFASWDPSQKKKGGIIFSGHTDVVPVTDQIWDTNPFEAVERDHKIYGRGAADMKGFLACMLASVPTIQSLNLQFPIHFAFSYDEEIGCLGAPFLIEDFLSRGIQPAACIVGEPSNMKPVISHKGTCGIHCSVIGKAAHSSLPHEGCNAIGFAAKLIVFIQNLARQLEAGKQDHHFDVPYTTMSTNKIEGGSAGNIIPAKCDFYFDLRFLPEDDPEQIIDEIKSFIAKEVLLEMQLSHKESEVKLKKMAAVPSFAMAQDAKFPQLVAEILNDYGTTKVAYATEAGQFHGAKIQTVVCGPGSIVQAHKPNEYIEIKQLEKCEHFISALLTRYNSSMA